MDPVLQPCQQTGPPLGTGFVQCRRAFDRRERGSACGFGPKSLGCSRCTLRWANGLNICLGEFSRPHCLPSLESWLIREIIPKRAEIKILQYTQICGQFHPEKMTMNIWAYLRGLERNSMKYQLYEPARVVNWESACVVLGSWKTKIISVVFLKYSRSILDGYFNPLVFWYQWEYLLTSKEIIFCRVSKIGKCI